MSANNVFISETETERMNGLEARYISVVAPLNLPFKHSISNYTTVLYVDLNDPGLKSIQKNLYYDADMLWVF